MIDSLWGFLSEYGFGIELPVFFFGEILFELLVFSVFLAVFLPEATYGRIFYLVYRSPQKMPGLHRFIYILFGGIGYSHEHLCL